MCQKFEILEVPLKFLNKLRNNEKNHIRIEIHTHQWVPFYKIDKQKMIVVKVRNENLSFFYSMNSKMRHAISSYYFQFFSSLKFLNLWQSDAWRAENDDDKM